jgi:hypothetical protein
MTPKEKTIELVNRFTDVEDGEMYIGKAKQCALIAVDEIIKALNDDIYIQGETDIDSHIEYWKEVKQEIDNV